MHHVDMLMCCLSALHTGLGDGRTIFCVCFKNSYDLKNTNSCSLTLQSSHSWFAAPYREENIFCPQNVSNAISSNTVFCYQWKVPCPQPHEWKSSLLQLQSSHANTLPFSRSLASLLIWLLLRSIKLLTSPSRWPSVAVPAVPTSWPWHHSASFKPLKS